MSCETCGYLHCRCGAALAVPPTAEALQAALRDTAQATVTALDRLILAEAVCRAAKELKRLYTGQHTQGPQTMLAQRDAKNALWAAIDAWEKGRPS